MNSSQRELEGLSLQQQLNVLLIKQRFYSSLFMQVKSRTGFGKLSEKLDSIEVNIARVRLAIEMENRHY